ncbi:pilin [Frankia sp. Cas4]|uniref:pilin n=1 Tax=Frankia sp. Cas4 TaxID=3073927 RepID=UPI002AD1FEBD|nr:pilin [Frankia sp. Cas4]
MRLTPRQRTVRDIDSVAGSTPVRPTVRWSLRCRAVLLAVAVSVFLLAGGSAALAAPAHEVLALAPNVDTVLTNIRNWIMGILAGLGTVFLTVGGLRYLMSGGDPGEVGKAKDAFKNAGWGYGLAALAPIAVDALKTIVGN